MSGDKPRAMKAGEQLGESIIEMTNLMYQNNTATNFLLGLKNKIDKEFKMRLSKGSE